MKGLGRDIVAAIFAGVILPAIAIQAGIIIRWDRRSEPLPPMVTDVSVCEESSLFVSFMDEEGNKTEMGLDEYLVGAVLGEMPASFEIEALKAQTVAARTYAWKVRHDGVKHGDGSICGNYACCQAYISGEEYIESGGSIESVEKVRSAVLATSDLVLMYDGNLIDATYFSCSGGRTEDALAVWGSDIPYLRSVDSPGEEHAKWYTDEMSFSRAQLESALDISLPENTEDWFGEISYTNGGGVETIRIGEELFSGTRLRSLLRLRSTSFDVTAENDAAVFTTRGYGHRVGMSQYGADAMAAAGADFGKILGHYYPGTEMVMLS